MRATSACLPETVFGKGSSDRIHVEQEKQRRKVSHNSCSMLTLLWFMWGLRE